MDVTHFMFTKQQTISYESMLPTFYIYIYIYIYIFKIWNWRKTL